MTDKVVELTGMDGKQFRQIVMIAQGEFRKFLLSSSVEKGKILRQLFHTQNCDKIQQILKSGWISRGHMSGNRKPRC